MKNKTKYTPGPWKYTIESGDKNGKYKDKLKRFRIDSGSRCLMFEGQAWLSNDDKYVFEEVETNFKLAAKAPELFEILKRLIAYYKPFEDKPEAIFKIEQAEKLTKEIEK